MNTEVHADVDEMFLSMLLDDPDFLRAEFDALVAASWGLREPTPGGPCKRTPGERPGDESVELWASCSQPPFGRRVDGWCRERSPPAPAG